MALRNLAEFLFGGGGEDPAAPRALGPRVGAAGLLVAAAHREGSYTDVEKDLVTAALMKLLMLTNPEAKALREEAENELFKAQRGFMAFAAAARNLDSDEREMLVSHLWRLVTVDGAGVGEDILVASTRFVLGFTRAQAEALKPAVG